MIISYKDIEKICNYVESKKPSLPQVTLMYVDFDESNDEEHKREIKRINRNLAIDAIIDDKVKEFEKRENIEWGQENGYYPVIAPMFKSLSVRGKSYHEAFDIYLDVMKTLESLTSSPMNIPQNMNVTIQIDPKLTHHENKLAISRRLFSRIMMVSNLIACSGRIGPANTIIIGMDAYEYLLSYGSCYNYNGVINTNNGIVAGNINGMDIIPSTHIKSNKIIIMRNIKTTMKQLRLTTTKPTGMLGIDTIDVITKPKEVGELIMDKIKGRSAYIHGEAENIAGFDIPTFIDGNLAQLELPIEQQDILLLLPSGEYKCKAEYYDEIGSSNCYLITLVTEPSVLVEKV